MAKLTSQVNPGTLTELEFRHTRHEYPEPEAPTCRRPKVKKRNKKQQQKKNMELDQTGKRRYHSDSV